MFGRDYYDSIHMELIERLGLDRAILDKICFKNAARLLNLPNRPDIAALADPR